MNILVLKKIHDDLSKMRGWNNGLVEINSNDLSRDMNTGLICEINQSIDYFNII